MPPRDHLINHPLDDRSVGIQLDLAGTVQDEVLVIVEAIQLFLEPVHVLQEVFHAVYEGTVGAEAELLHDVLDGDEVPDVECDVVGEVLGGWVEVCHVDVASSHLAEGGAVLLDGGAVGALA